MVSMKLKKDLVENKQKTIIEKFISDVTCGATEKSQILKSQQKSVLLLLSRKI